MFCMLLVEVRVAPALPDRPPVGEADEAEPLSPLMAARKVVARATASAFFR
ncbi:hypothetical protein D3C78_1873110 [compost metagenome]